MDIILYIHISKLYLFSRYIICMYVFRSFYFVLNKQLACTSWGRLFLLFSEFHPCLYFCVWGWDLMIFLLSTLAWLLLLTKSRSCVRESRWWDFADVIADIIRWYNLTTCFLILYLLPPLLPYPLSLPHSGWFLDIFTGTDLHIYSCWLVVVLWGLHQLQGECPLRTSLMKWSKGEIFKLKVQDSACSVSITVCGGRTEAL